MGDADRLEHGDREDAVHGAVPVAVVQQLETHAVGEALLLGPRPRRFQLLDRERDAGDPRAPVARQRQRHAAPAATDLQHLQPGPVEPQLGRDVALLERLRLVQRFLAGREVGAGVLQVAVQEEREEPPVQVVMVGRIAAGAGRRVELVEAPLGAAHELHRPRGRVRAAGAVPPGSAQGRRGDRGCRSRPARSRRPCSLHRRQGRGRGRCAGARARCGSPWPLRAPALRRRSGGPRRRGSGPSAPPGESGATGWRAASCIVPFGVRVGAWGRARANGRRLSASGSHAAGAMRTPRPARART